MGFHTTGRLFRSLGCFAKSQDYWTHPNLPTPSTSQDIYLAVDLP